MSAFYRWNNELYLDSASRRIYNSIQQTNELTYAV